MQIKSVSIPELHQPSIASVKIHIQPVAAIHLVRTLHIQPFSKNIDPARVLIERPVFPYHIDNVIILKYIPSNLSVRSGTIHVHGSYPVILPGDADNQLQHFSFITHFIARFSECAAFEHICRPASVFRPAGLTSPPEPDAAGELRRHRTRRAEMSSAPPDSGSILKTKMPCDPASHVSNHKGISDEPTDPFP